MAEKRAEGRGEERERPARPEEVRAEIERLLAEIRALENLASAVQELALRTQAYMAELRAAGRTLEALAGREGAEVLVPIGAGSFIWARVERVDKAIVSLGADVSVEVDVERAKEMIGERLGEADKALSDYLTRLREIQQAIEARRQRIRALAEVLGLAGGAEERAKEVPG